MPKAKEYTLRQLQADLKRLDKKAETLADWMEKSKDKNPIDYLAADEITEKLVMPVYIAKRIELYSRYFGLTQKVTIDAEKRGS